jgi:uncharacterized protein
MIARAMTTRPAADVFEPVKLARKAAVWRGRVPLTALPRLSETVSHTDGSDASGATVAVDLRFFCDAQQRPRVSGSAVTQVALTCQRCLEPVAHQLNVTLELWLVRSDEEAARLGTDQEPFVLGSERIAIADLIEDDLLLALPEQVCPNVATCPHAPALTYPAGPVGEQPASGKGADVRQNPFQRLQQLKDRDNE